MAVENGIDVGWINKRVIPWEVVDGVVDDCLRDLRENRTYGASTVDEGNVDIDINKLSGIITVKPRSSSFTGYYTADCKDDVCKIEVKDKIRNRTPEIQEASIVGAVILLLAVLGIATSQWRCDPVEPRIIMLDSWQRSYDVLTGDDVNEGEDAHADQAAPPDESSPADAPAEAKDATTDDGHAPVEEVKIDSSGKDIPIVDKPLEQIVFEDPQNEPEEQAAVCDFASKPSKWSILTLMQGDTLYMKETGGIPPSVLIDEPPEGVKTSMLIKDNSNETYNCQLEHYTTPGDPMTRWQLFCPTLVDDEGESVYDYFTMLTIGYSVEEGQAVYMQMKGEWEGLDMETDCSSTFDTLYQEVK